MEEWVTVSEAARRHGVSRATIGNWMKAGRCQHRLDNRGNPQVLAPAKASPAVPAVTGETLSVRPPVPAPTANLDTTVAIAALERVIADLRVDSHRREVVLRREIEMLREELARPLRWTERLTGHREARVLGG